MKIPLLACVPLISIVACTPQQSVSTNSPNPTWLGADPNAGPTHVGGSAANTTNAFDGTYRVYPKVAPVPLHTILLSMPLVL